MNQQTQTIIAEERAAIQKELERLQIRHRINKRIGNFDMLPKIEADMEQLEAALNELAAIEAEQPHRDSFQKNASTPLPTQPRILQDS